MKEEVKALLVGDEIIFAMIIKDTFEENDFILTIVANGEEGLCMSFDIRPDVLAVDVIISRMDGLKMVRRIRQTDKQTPVFFLTVRPVINDVVEGSELGANDCLKRSFGVQELATRIKALIDKAFGSAEERKITTWFEIGNCLLDTLAQTLTHAELKQELPHRKTETLKRLCEGQNQVVNTQNVLLDLWGDDGLFSLRSLHVLITKLRHKLSADGYIYIVNVRGIGYKLILN